MCQRIPIMANNCLLVTNRYPIVSIGIVRAICRRASAKGPPNNFLGTTNQGNYNSFWTTNKFLNSISGKELWKFASKDLWKIHVFSSDTLNCFQTLFINMGNKLGWGGAIYSQTSLIRASLICMLLNPNILPGHLFHRFLFTMCQ